VTTGRPRALLVEADASVRSSLVHALDDAGFTVAVARNGSAAIAAVSLSVPDVVVLDLDVPDLPALDVLGAVRRAGADRVVLLAGPGREEDGEVGVTLGAAASLGKPVAVAALLASLREALLSPGSSPPR
jgi:DNA-binding response OmpR family regulator